MDHTVFMGIWAKYFKQYILMDHLIYLLNEYKYIILFPLAIIEGPILAVIAGFLCMRGILNFWIVLPVIVMADMISDSACFFLGRKGIPAGIKKLIYWLGFPKDRLRKAKYFIETHPNSFIPMSKFTLGIGVLGIYLTGHAGISYKRFIIICLVTSICQYLFYLSMGLMFGNAYVRIGQYLDYTATAIILLFLVIILFIIIQSLSRKL
jgi:membrane-associated protein